MRAGSLGMQAQLEGTLLRGPASGVPPARTLISLWPPSTARAFAWDTAMRPGAPEDLTPDMDLDASHVREFPSTPALRLPLPTHLLGASAIAIAKGGEVERSDRNK